MIGATGLPRFLERVQEMDGGEFLAYRLFIPGNYRASRKYPLMLTLHGAGERGDDNASQLRHGFNAMWAEDRFQDPHPFFVVAPQCPADGQWVDVPWSVGSYDADKSALSEPLKAVVAILDSLAGEFNLDAGRIYVSGISMGGYATWHLAMKYPDRFAAIIPVCGAADPGKAASLSDLPIWTFHAEDDGTVPVQGTREMVAALQAAGNRVIYTEYPAAMGINHESWIPAGNTPELVPWILRQSRST